MTIETELQELKDLKEDLDFIEHNKKIDELTASIKAEVLSTGTDVETDIADVNIRQKYKRGKWDGKKLQGLAIAYPEIMECFSETNVKESVAIKFKT